jgi:protein TonB
MFFNSMYKYFSILSALIAAVFLPAYPCYADVSEAPKKITIEQKKTLVELEAKIAALIEKENSLPKKSYISPSTKNAGQALYYASVGKRLEKVGTCNWPKKNGKKLYGTLIVSLPVYQDGTVYQKVDGPIIEVSSGDDVLDKAALNAIKRAAPFDPIPQDFRTPGREDVWVLVYRFSYINDDSNAPKIDCSKK